MTPSQTLQWWTDEDLPVVDPDVVRRDPDRRVVEALPGAQVEGLLVHRRRDERRTAASPDDAARQHRGTGERVVVGHRIDVSVVCPEDCDRGAADQGGDAALDLDLVEPAHRRPGAHGAPTGIVAPSGTGAASSGAIWPRSSRKLMLGSGTPGAFTKETNLASFSGSSIVAFHSST